MTDQTMSPATFRAYMTMMGLTAPFLAARCEVSEQSVWKYTHRDRAIPVPLRAMRAMQDLITDWDDSLTAAAERIAVEGGDVPFHRDPDAWRADNPALHGWPDGAQGPWTAALMEHLGGKDAEYV
jgi:hypothetical protein